MRRIETPTLVNACTLTYGIEPGGTIEAVIDDGRFVYEIADPIIKDIDQMFGRVTLDRPPVGKITLLVNRPDAPAPDSIIEIPGSLGAVQAKAIQAAFAKHAAPTELHEIAGYLDRIERHLDRLVNRGA